MQSSPLDRPIFDLGPNDQPHLITCLRLLDADASIAREEVTIPTLKAAGEHLEQRRSILDGSR